MLEANKVEYEPQSEGPYAVTTHSFNERLLRGASGSGTTRQEESDTGGATVDAQRDKDSDDEFQRQLEQRASARKEAPESINIQDQSNEVSYTLTAYLMWSQSVANILSLIGTSSSFDCAFPSTSHAFSSAHRTPSIRALSTVSSLSIEYEWGVCDLVANIFKCQHLPTRQSPSASARIS